MNRVAMNNDNDRIQEWPRNGAYLTFNAGEEHFAIDIRWVQEIVGFHKITCPRKGIHAPVNMIQLRGRDVSAVDMRLVCKERISNTSQTSIIVLRNTGTNSGVQKAVLVADDVGAVTCLKTDDISTSKSFIKNDAMVSLVAGVVHINKVPYYLIDVSHVFEQIDHPEQGSHHTTERSGAKTCIA